MVNTFTVLLATIVTLQFYYSEVFPWKQLFPFFSHISSSSKILLNLENGMALYYPGKVYMYAHLKLFTQVQLS